MGFRSVFISQDGPRHYSHVDSRSIAWPDEVSGYVNAGPFGPLSASCEFKMYDDDWLDAIYKAIDWKERTYPFVLVVLHEDHSVVRVTMDAAGIEREKMVAVGTVSKVIDGSDENPGIVRPLQVDKLVANLRYGKFGQGAERSLVRLSVALGWFGALFGTHHIETAMKVADAIERLEGGAK